MSSKHHIAFDDIVHSLDANKDKIALIDKEGLSYTYGEFKQHITGTRAHLESLGVKKGTKVLVFVTMSMELYTVLEALFSLGATTIFLDPWMKGRKMGQIIRKIEPELLILNKKAAKYSWLLSSTWKIKKWKIKDLPSNMDEWKIADVRNDDTALVTFTSGSTGIPKGANRTYSFIDAQAKALKARLIGNSNEQNIDYTNLPIVALAGFAIGNTVVIPKINLMQVQKADPGELIDHLRDTNVSRLVVSPSLLKKILKGIKLKGKANIREIVTGGAPISASLVKDCIENHSDILFESIYGSTEVEPISGAEMKDIYDNLSSPLKGVFVGTIDDKLQFKILEPTRSNVDASYFEDHQLQDGQVGEIVVSGGHVNKSYYEDETAFKRYKIVDHQGQVWHRTGDMGQIENNEVFLVGRDNRIIKSGSETYHPFPLEQFLEQKFGLTDCGYVQKESGKIILYVGSGDSVIKKELIEGIREVNYPIDDIIFQDNPLPRDPRHQSKLQVDKLM